MLCLHRWPRERAQTAPEMVSDPSPSVLSYPAPAHTPILILASYRVDVAHLILYHLSICCKKKYFDFEREILPFANENWDNLLLGEVGREAGAGEGALCWQGRRGGAGGWIRLGCSN